MYTSASVANAFLSKAFDKSETISPMKLQKLCYIAHGYFLATCEEPLIDEVFEAWKFGPVLHSLYQSCKSFGKKGVNSYLTEIDWEQSKMVPAAIPDADFPREVIDFVWDNYGKYGGIQLSNWTHQKDGPWANVTDCGRNILKHQDVPNDLVKAYFKKLLGIANNEQDNGSAGEAQAAC